jgi:hypothetical protein
MMVVDRCVLDLVAALPAEARAPFLSALASAKAWPDVDVCALAEQLALVHMAQAVAMMSCGEHYGGSDRRATQARYRRDPGHSRAWPPTRISGPPRRFRVAV